MIHYIKAGISTYYKVQKINLNKNIVLVIKKKICYCSRNFFLKVRGNWVTESCVSATQAFLRTTYSIRNLSTFWFFQRTPYLTPAPSFPSSILLS